MQRSPKTARITTVGALFLSFAALVAAVGCGGPRAHFQTRLPAQVNVGGIERVAVADFDGLRQTGRMVSAKLTQGIVDNGHFRMFERAKLQDILNERDFSHSDHVDPRTANRLKLSGVDAFIFGAVDVYSIDDQTGFTEVETEVGTGEFEIVREKGKNGKTREVRREITKKVTIKRPHIVREGTMGATFRMANVNTGEIVAISAETANFSKKAWRHEKEKLPTKDEVLDRLVAQVSHRFLVKIQPQTVTRTARFEKNELPETSVGIKYAQSGLWDDAATALKSATLAGPAVASAHYNLGIAYDALGWHEEAASAMQEAISIEPKDDYIQALAKIRLNASNARALELQESGRD